jgi:hypothetical protein
VSWYSFNIGSWHLIALDSNQPSNSQQLAWLENDVATHSNQCTLAFWHHPRFNSGSTHGDNTGVGTFWTRLYNANADVVLNGHEHVFERFAPQTPEGVSDPVRGIREFIVGTGGRSHYAFGTAKANSEVRNSNTFGVLKVTLHSTSYNWAFQPVSGGTFTDSGSGSCH